MKMILTGELAEMKKKQLWQAEIQASQEEWVYVLWQQNQEKMASTSARHWWRQKGEKPGMSTEMD